MREVNKQPEDIEDVIYNYFGIFCFRYKSQVLIKISCPNKDQNL